MELLGRVVRVQVQESSLKVGAPPRRYDPAGIRVVSRLTLDSDGVTGWIERGERVNDVHNRTHPASKNRRGVNGISVGFTAHYAAIRACFGEHLTDGIAGENILVRGERMVREDEAAGGLVIVTAAGARLRLSRVIVAEPCVEFSRYAARFPLDARANATLKEALNVLRGGMRGYYAAYDGESTDVCVGDSVYLA